MCRSRLPGSRTRTIRSAPAHSPQDLFRQNEAFTGRCSGRSASSGIFTMRQDAHKPETRTLIAIRFRGFAGRTTALMLSSCRASSGRPRNASPAFFDTAGGTAAATLKSRGFRWQFTFAAARNSAVEPERALVAKKRNTGYLHVVSSFVHPAKQRRKATPTFSSFGYQAARKSSDPGELILAAAILKNPGREKSDANAHSAE